MRAPSRKARTARRLVTLLALSALILSIAAAAAAKGTPLTVILPASAPHAHVPWTITVRTAHARRGYRPVLVILDRGGSFGGSFHGTRVASGVYRINIVFPHAGSWRYQISDPVLGDWSFVAPHVAG